MTKQYVNIYCRFSERPDATTSKSNQQQEERCRIYCERKGYIVVSVYCDESVSGAIFDRPGLTRVLADLTTGMILVVDTADRLARDVLIMLTICAQIKAAGCTLEYADGTQNRTTKEGRLLQTILGGIAEYQRDGIAERTKAGLAKKKANGQHLGRAPLGYQYIKETKQLIENPQELLAIKCIRGYKGYEMAISSQLIADTINKEFGPCRGKKWSPRTIRKLLNKEKSS